MKDHPRLGESFWLLMQRNEFSQQHVGLVIIEHKDDEIILWGKIVNTSLQSFK